MNIQLCNMRLTKEKPYYMNQLGVFAGHMVVKFNAKSVEFGKQDIRGGFSICLFNDVGCITQQKHFTSKDEMLGYVIGYNATKQEYL